MLLFPFYRFQHRQKAYTVIQCFTLGSSQQDETQICQKGISPLLNRGLHSRYFQFLIATKEGTWSILRAFVLLENVKDKACAHSQPEKSEPIQPLHANHRKQGSLEKFRASCSQVIYLFEVVPTVLGPVILYSL